MTGRVLIVEDEPELAELMQVYLQKEGLQAQWVDHAEDALRAVRHESYDVIVLDINLPGMDGFEFLQEFRRDSFTPVMIVSAREADEDIVMGLGIGADEFITKPFSPRVFAARVRSHVRRQRMTREASDERGSSSTEADAAERETYRFAAFELDAVGYLLRRDGQPVQMSPREFELLRFLVRHAGEVYSTDELYERVWEQEYGDTSAIPVYIQRIRKKIEQDYRRPELIVTIHGKGYRFNREALRTGSTKDNEA